MDAKKRKDIGTTISSLGGLFTIFSISADTDSRWGLPLAVLGVVLAVGGLMYMQGGKKEDPS